MGPLPLIVALLVFQSASQTLTIASNVEDPSRQQQLADDSYKAIRSLHTKLDVDADGEVDDFESKKFLESENKNALFTTKTGAGDNNKAKLRYLHQDGKDKSISVDELWHAWQSSQVHNWTVSETIDWLVNSVELPEYSGLFEQKAINGTLMPRLAADMHFISKLGITDPSAKSKISIKAMDVVLFGPPKLHGSNSKLRDIIVTIVILIAISTCVIFHSRSRASQKALQAMQDDLESLQKAEDQMIELQQELNKAHKAMDAVTNEKKNLEHQLEMQRQFSASSLNSNSVSSDNNVHSIKVGDSNLGQEQEAYVAKLEDEVKSLRDELKDVNDSVLAKKFRAPFPLRSLLQTTYNIESQYYNERKLNLESKVAEAKLRNQKLQKKKATFLGYYKMAQENSLEEGLNAIAEVKEAIMQVTREIKEHTERWRAIEELCGCSLNLSNKLPSR